MTPVRRFLAVTTLALLTAACGTVMPGKQSGFLGDYSALAAAPGSPAATRPARQAIDPARVTLGAIEWRVAPGSDIAADEREALLAELRAELEQRVAALPPQPQGQPAVVRAAITRVSTVSPALNAVSAALLVVPLDRGGAALEIEAVDPQSGRQLAAMTLGYFAPMTEIKARFSRLAPAGIAVRKAAADFAVLLKQGPDARQDSAER